MAGETVFITGGSGHLGHRVILEALRAGYSVRAAVRSLAKADNILKTPTIKKENPDNRLKFVQVPDMLQAGAYDEALQGVTYAIHVASPITTAYKEGDDYNEVFIKPALQGTLNLLEAAKKSGSVKRVVITSSVVAILPWESVVGANPDVVYDEKSRTETPAGPFQNTFEAYAASKVSALNASEAWIKENKPSFDLVNIFPAFIIGANELASTAEDALVGTNDRVIGPAIGKHMGPTPAASIHVHDVALAHVKSLDPKIPGNQGYVLSSSGLQGTRWEDVTELVAKNFPDAVKSGKLPNNGSIQTIPTQLDERRSEELLGFKYLNLEEQVRSAVGHYLTVA